MPGFLATVLTINGRLKFSHERSLRTEERGGDLVEGILEAFVRLKRASRNYRHLPVLAVNVRRLVSGQTAVDQRVQTPLVFGGLLGFDPRRIGPAFYLVAPAIPMCVDSRFQCGIAKIGGLLARTTLRPRAARPGKFSAGALRDEGFSGQL